MGVIAADKPVMMKGSTSKHVLNSIYNLPSFFLNREYNFFSTDASKGSSNRGLFACLQSFI